jgi:hypothetical protein
MSATTMNTAANSTAGQSCVADRIDNRQREPWAGSCPHPAAGIGERRYVLSEPRDLKAIGAKMPSRTRRETGVGNEAPTSATPIESLSKSVPVLRAGTCPRPRRRGFRVRRIQSIAAGTTMLRVTGPVLASLEVTSSWPRTSSKATARRRGRRVAFTDVPAGKDAVDEVDVLGGDRSDRFPGCA